MVEDPSVVATPEAVLPQRVQQKTGSSLIVPPPELKKIIDKLAKRVASKSETEAGQFTELILKNDPNNPNFNFLRNENDPYRLYYF